MIQGERVVLRPVEEADLSYLTVWLNDPEVASGVLRNWPLSQDGARSWLERRKGSLSTLPFAICERPDQRPVGLVEIADIHWVHQLAELWIIIGDKTRWGRGLASEALALLLDYAFKNLGLRKMHVKARADNPAAARLYLKCGFVQEGVFIKEYLSGGEYVDLIRMAVFNPRR
jgi:RimJ/RimL family protein N-acetyltransferase